MPTHVRPTQLAVPTFVSDLRKNSYNNGLIAKLILMWRREERREMIAWLLVKHQAGHGCIVSSGPKKQML